MNNKAYVMTLDVFIGSIILLGVIVSTNYLRDNNHDTTQFDLNTINSIDNIIEIFSANNYYNRNINTLNELLASYLDKNTKAHITVAINTKNFTQTEQFSFGSNTTFQREIITSKKIIFRDDKYEIITYKAWRT